MGDGLFPAGYSDSIFESAGCCGDPFALLCSLGGSLVFNVAEHQSQRLQHGFIVGELHPAASGFSQFVVKRFNGIRRIDDLAGTLVGTAETRQTAPMRPARPWLSVDTSHPARKPRIRLRPP